MVLQLNKRNFGQEKKDSLRKLAERFAETPRTRPLLDIILDITKKSPQKR